MVNILDWITPKALARRSPAPPARDRYTGATILTGEKAAPKWVYNNPNDELVARASGTVYQASSIKSRCMRDLDLRLYRAADAVQLAERVGRRSVTARLDDYATRSLRRGERERLRFHPSQKRYARTADEIVEVTDHPALDLLHAGNPFDCGAGVLELIYFFLDLTGNAYLHMVEGANGEPVELWPLPSQHTVIRASEDSYIESYVYSRNRTEVAVFDPGEVIHAKLPNPHNPFYGLSWLGAFLVEADISQAQKRQVLASYLNGAVPPVVAELPGHTPEQVQQFVNMWEARNRGPQNANRMQAVSSNEAGAITFHQLSTTPEALQLVDHLVLSRDEIMGAAGVPKALYATDDVNRAAAKEARAIFAETTLAPMMTYVAAALTELMLPAFGVDPGDMWFGIDLPDAADPEAEASRMNTLVSGAILTPNEARQELGYEPLDDPDADALRDSSQADPFSFGFDFGDASAPARLVKRRPIDPTQPEPRPEPEEPQDAKTGDQETAPIKTAPKPDTPHDRKAEPLSLDQSDLYEGADCGCGHHEADPLIEVARKAWDGKAEDTPRDPEAQFVRDTSALLRQQADAIRDWITANAGRVTAFTTDAVSAGKSYGRKDMPPWVERVFELLAEYGSSEYIDAATEAFADVMQAEPAEVDFDVTQGPSQRFWNEYRASLGRTANLIDQHTNRVVTATIRDGIESGESVQTIASQVHERLAGSSPERALRIARTESARARGEAKEAGWAASNVVTAKRWSTAPNECEFCRVLDGAVRPIGTNFVELGETVRGADGGTLSVNYKAVSSHPLHPNCRCDVQPITESDS